VRVDGKNVDLRRYLIDLLLKLGRSREAVQQYQELAALCEATGHPDEALVCYQQVVALQPENAWAAERLQTAIRARRGVRHFLPGALVALGFVVVLAAAYLVYGRYRAIEAFRAAREAALR